VFIPLMKLAFLSSCQEMFARPKLAKLALETVHIRRSLAMLAGSLGTELGCFSEILVCFSLL
jgi:hypothetical protein